MFLISLLVNCFLFHVAADQLANTSANLSTLVHLQIICRHGDRNPWILLPDDPNNGPETWPEGLGELTRLGIEQGFHLGQLIRRRYTSFLPVGYGANDFYMRSSDRNRTLMSAQVILAGMFPRLGMNYTDQINPIPVHSTPFEQDAGNIEFLSKLICVQILNDHPECPAADEEERAVYASPKYKEMEQKFENLLGLMGKESGFNKIPLPFRDVWLVYDSLFEVFVHSDTHKLPAWVDKAILWQISQAYELSSYGIYDSQKLKRLRAGPIVKDVLERAQQKIDGNLPDQKMYAYSGHDTSIASFLVGLGIKFPVFPLHSTALMIELHKDPRDETYVLRIFYRNDTKNDDIYELDIPNCEQPCKFESISQQLQATLIPNNWLAECNLIPNDADAFPYLLFIFILVCIAVILAFAIVCLQFYQINNSVSFPKNPSNA
ncbi:Histidine phosphatase superfamily, clade-2-containing protein [Aphelenchoides bicaudatus]|nr:Histidine phosphatase superfamily, clade-2-containing protein [Aphelenchoides bicaudatus]